MVVETKAETRGTAFVRVFDYGEDKQWERVIVVQNEEKDLTEKVVTDWVTRRARASDGGVDLAKLEQIVAGERVQFCITLIDLLKFAANRDVLKRHMPMDFPQHSLDYWLKAGTLADGRLSEDLLKKTCPRHLFPYTLADLVRLSRDVSGKPDPLQLAKHMIARINKPILKRAGKGLPGGGVRSDETPEEGALRELFEEAKALINVAKVLKDKLKESRPDEDFDYLIYQEDEEAMTIQRFEKILVDLEGIDKAMNDCPKNSPELRRVILTRNQIFKEYAAMAEKLGLIRLCPKHSRPNADDGSPVWVFEIDAKHLISREGLSSRCDTARNTLGALWFTRDEAEDVARNYREFSKNDATRFYRSHLERLDLTTS